MKPKNVSIILPVLNESARIACSLEALKALVNVFQVIVVDGGSTDETPHIVSQYPFAQLLHSPRGRAKQMNTGAAAAAGDILLFLHADVTLPPNAVELVRRAIEDGAVGGAFITWTVAHENPPFWAALLHLADIRSRYTKYPYGDQAIFVKREVFERLGGFTDIAILEDLEFSQRLAAAGKITRVRERVMVSGRRFVAHPLRYTFIVNVLPALYSFGVSPKWLSTMYNHVR